MFYSSVFLHKFGFNHVLFISFLAEMVPNSENYSVE